jgi:hypothetical protein
MLRSGEVLYLVSGGGFEGDLVAEGFELADVVALVFWVDARVAVAGAQVMETDVGIGR